MCDGPMETAEYMCENIWRMLDWIVSMGKMGYVMFNTFKMVKLNA